MRTLKVVGVLLIITISSLMIFSFITITTKAQFDDCDSSYPDICIPSPPPDLNCGDISDKRFIVIPPDPHGFDRDKDGIGCES